MPKYKCKLCKDVEFDNYTSLSRHMGRTHKMDTTQFYVDYHLDGVWPLCKCGCKERVLWSWQLKGFRDYCQGHQSRVHNNWGHNQKAIDASSETRRQQYASGERQVWNDGLTTDDKRVRNNIDILTKFTRTPSERKVRSERMRKGRSDGTIPDLKGSEHSQWKGGVSSINVLVRARVKLYKEWKYPILIRDGFKCVQCGATTPLHVHHDKEQMCEIIQKHLVDDMNPKTFQEKEMIADAVVDYHINNKVSGVTLCGRCHEEKHPSLNFG
jgi:hypothetical protein